MKVVDGCDAAGIVTVDGSRVQTLAASEGKVRTSDAHQGEVGEGPCFDAAGHPREVYRVFDLSTGHRERWPQYAPRARQLGIGNMMGFPLYTEHENLGALNLYSSTPGAFDAESEHAGRILASHAAVAFSGARTHAQLDNVLETRHEIGAALGILMERYSLGPDQAFTTLKSYSQHHNIKLREIARTIAEGGELPGTP